MPASRGRGNFLSPATSRKPVVNTRLKLLCRAKSRDIPFQQFLRPPPVFSRAFNMATAGDLNVPRGTGHPEPHEKARTTGGHTSTMGVGGSHEGPDVLTSIAGGNKHLSKRESAKAAHDKMENVGEIPPSDEFQHDLSKNFIPQASKQSHRMGVAPCVDEEGADSRVRAQRLEPGDNVARDAMKKLLETGAIGQTIPPARARIASGSNPSTSSSR